MKKILFFTYDFPYPTNTGGKNRAYNLMKYASNDIDLHLFSFTRKDFKDEYKKKLQEFGVRHITVFPRKRVINIKMPLSIIDPFHSVFYHLYFEPSIQRQLEEYVEKNKVDVIHYESFYTCFYANLSFRKQQVRQIHGSENIEHKLYDEYARNIAFPALRPFYKNEARKIKKEEALFCSMTDLVIAVTDEEADFFRELGARQTYVIPNGVDVDEFRFAPKKNIHGSKILFVGNFSYFPNRDAIEFFYNNVFQKLEGKYLLTIIGKGAKKLGIVDSKVILIDFIPDIRDAYYDADILISPVRIGGGTNFKLLEAAACGLPIVAHPSRMSSLGFIPDEHVLVANSADEFSEKVEMLLNNDALQGKLAANARKLVEEKFDWKVIGKKLNDIWRSL